MKLGNVIRLVVIVTALGFGIRLAIGLTVNERYEEAVVTLKEYGVYHLHENNSVTYTTCWEVERKVIKALNEVSKRHEILLYTI